MPDYPQETTMADAKDDVPQIPVSPVESTPVAVIPPIVDLAGSGTAAPQANPYAPVGVNPYAAPAPAYQAQPYGYPGYAAAPPSGLSITSLILGIAGLVFGILLSIAAVITGHIAKKSQPHAKGMWLTGLITGYVGIGIWALVLLVYLLIVVFAFAASSAYGYSDTTF
jgi:hypothetical protein